MKHLQPSSLFESQIAEMQSDIAITVADHTVQAQTMIFESLQKALAEQAPSIVFNDREAAPVAIPYITATWSFVGEAIPQQDNQELVPHTQVSVEAQAFAALPSRQVEAVRDVLAREKRVKAPKLLGIEGSSRMLSSRKRYDDVELSRRVGAHMLESGADLIIAAHTDFAAPAYDSNDHVTKAKHAESLETVVGRPASPSPDSPLLWTPNRTINETRGYILNHTGRERAATLHDVGVMLQHATSIKQTPYGLATEQYATLDIILQHIPVAR